MASSKPRALIEVSYEHAAQEYLRNLPPEHFMEAAPQSRQREITLESLAVLQARRPDVQVFNELLVQYPLPGQRKPGQVVPDNMVVLAEEPVKAVLSFNLPLEKAQPFWMLEYVSKSSRRKDYEDSFDKYERDLKTPYYLTFYPDEQELTLHRHSGMKYVSVKPNAAGRLEIPELELEIGLHQGWVRYWYQGNLLPLPAELQRKVDAQEQELQQTRQQLAEEKQRADELAGRIAALEQELARLRGLEPPPPPRTNGRK